MDNAAISAIKKSAISSILQNQEIVQALELTHEDAMYHNIYPSFRIPDTELEAKTYITVQVDIDMAARNNGVVRVVYLSVFVITHQTKQYMDNGSTRIDHIAEQIELMFNKNIPAGPYQMELINDKEDNIDRFHPCRIIRFKTFWQNTARCV